MDTSEEKPRAKPSGLRPPWTTETAPRGSDRGSGRPPGSGLKTLREAFTAELARAVNAKDARTIAEALATQAAKFARKGDSRYLEIIRRITEGDRLAVMGPNGEPLGPNVVVIHRVVKSEPASRLADAVENGNGRH